jgi:hypothetical protein
VYCLPNKNVQILKTTVIDLQMSQGNKTQYIQETKAMNMQIHDYLFAKA